MADSPPPDNGALLADWITIWQSEWAAAAVDREVQEAWLQMAVQAGMAQAGMAQAGAVPPPQAPADAAPGPARPVPPARSPAVDVAPDARDAAIAGLLDRVAELERRAAAADPAGR